MAFTLLGSQLLPSLALLPQENRKALGALVVLYPSLSFANSEFTFSNNLRLNRNRGDRQMFQASADHSGGEVVRSDDAEWQADEGGIPVLVEHCCPATHSFA